MASLEFQPVPAGTSAWDHRGATFYVRLLGAAAGSFREAFADVAVPDPHDADVKVVELSVLEFVVLRACTLDSDALELEFHLYAVEAAALARVESALGRCGFDFTSAPLESLADRMQRLEIPAAEQGNFCLAAGDFIDLQDCEDSDEDDPDLQHYPLGTEQVELADLVNPYTMKLTPMADLSLLVRSRWRSLDRRPARCRFRNILSACFKAAATFADDRDPDAEDFRAHLGQFLVASSFPFELLKAPVELAMARADVRSRSDMASDRVLRVVRDRWGLFLPRLGNLSQILGGTDAHLGTTLAQQLAVGLELSELKSIAHFHNLELQAGKYLYVLSITTSAGQPQHLDAAARVAAITAEFDRSQRRSSGPSFSSASSITADSSSRKSGGNTASLAGAFHASNVTAFNRWLAVNKPAICTSLTDSFASGCSKRVLRKALGMQHLAVLQFLTSKVSSPSDDLFSKLLMHRGHLRPYISFTLSTPEPSLSARLAFQATPAAAASTAARLQNAEQALKSQGIFIPKPLQDYEISLELFENFIAGKWHSHCDFYNDGARAIALKAAGGGECALPALAWPLEVFTSKQALTECQKFGDALLNCIGYAKESELGWHGLFGEAANAVDVTTSSVEAGARLWNVVRPQLERAADRFSLSRMGDAEFGFPKFSLESDPFFEAIVTLRRDTEYTAHLFESYSHLRPPQVATVPAQLAAAAVLVDGTAAAATAAADKAAKDAKRKADADAKALKAKRQKEAARKVKAENADGGAGGGAGGGRNRVGHNANVTIGKLSDKVSVSGDVLTVLYQPQRKDGSAPPAISIKKSISKLDAAFAAHGENPLACKACYVVRAHSRLEYCNHADHADHASPTSPAHAFKLDADARVALCRECGV